MSSRCALVGRGTAVRRLGLAVGLVLSLGVASSVRAQSGEPEHSPASPESRLLEAEILELADGDLDAAMEVYRELAENADAPADLSARALFALGRCHRKKGELGAARDRFHELIERFPEQPRLVDLARRFAAEIEAGRSELPEFDWMSQVGANPEIQARIFELGMQLVEGGVLDLSGEGAGIKQKIRALGVITIPVLDPMLENSRVPEHRVDLAQVLVELGRVERLPVYIEGCPESVNGWMAFIDRVRDLPPDRRRAAADVLRPLEMERDASRELLAALRLVLDVTERFDEDLGHVGESWWHVSKIVLARDEAARRVAAYLASRGDADELSAEMGTGLATSIMLLLEHRPDLVRREQLAGLLRVTSEPSTNRREYEARQEYETRLGHLTMELMGLDRFDLALYLADADPTGSASRQIVTSLPLIGAWEDRGTPIGVAKQASLLRRTRKFERLHRLALERDEAIPEFVTYLLEDEQESWFRGELSVFGARAWIEDLSSSGEVARRLGGPRPSLVEAMTVPDVSVAHADAMLSVLQRTEDPVVRVIALLALGRAEAHGDRRYFEPLLRALRNGIDSEQDAFLTFVGAAGVLRHVASSPDRAESGLPAVERYVRVTPQDKAQYARLGASQFFRRQGDEAPRTGWDGKKWVRETGARVRQSSRPVPGNRPETPASAIEFVLGDHHFLLEPPGSPGAEGALVKALLYCAYGPEESTIVRGVERVLPLAVDGLVRGSTPLVFEGLASAMRRFDPDVLARALALRLNEITESECVRTVLRTGLDLFTGASDFPARFFRQAVGDAEIDAGRRRSVLERMAHLVSTDHPHAEDAERFLTSLDWSQLLSRPDIASSICDSSVLRPYVVSHAAAAIEDPVERVREFAVQHVPESDPAYWSVIEKGLADEDPGVRAQASSRVFSVESTTALPWLHSLSETGPSAKRVAAIGRIAYLGDESSLSHLAGFLDDSDIGVRNAALEAMKEIERKLAERERLKERYGAGSSKPEPPK